MELAEQMLVLARGLPFERYELDGLRVILCPAPVPISHIRICIDGGAVADPPGKTGLAHITEHLLFQGTKQKSVKEISQRLAQLGGHYDAQTSHYTTLFSADVSATDRCAALELFEEIVFEPLFDAKAISEMKGVIVNEITEYANIPEHAIEEEGMRSLFPTHPIRNPILGTKESLAQITKDDVLRFHSKFYTKENTIIAIAGAVDGAEEEIKEIFKKAQRGKAQIILPTETEPYFTEKTITKQGVEGVYLWVGFRAPSLGHRDRFALSIANSILRRKLFTQIRELWGLVYDIASIYEPFKDVGVVTIVTHTSAQKVEEVRVKIIEQIERLKEITDEEIELAKKRALLAFALDFESPSDLADRAIEKEIYGFDYVEILERLIGLTKEDIVAAAEKYFDTDKSVLIKLEGG